MNIRHALAAVATAALMPTALTLAASPALAGGSYQYNFQEHGANDSFTDSGLCSDGPATIDLINYNEALHVTADQAGLSQDQIEALLGQQSGTISKLTYTQEGAFRITESDGHVYAGHFTTWFGGSVNRDTSVFGGTFNLTGTSDDGRQISGHAVSHVTFKNGEPVVSVDTFSMTGC